MTVAHRQSPESALISAEGAKLNRERRECPIRLRLVSALDAFVAEHGPGEGAGFCAINARRLYAQDHGAGSARDRAERCFRPRLVGGE